MKVLVQAHHKRDMGLEVFLGPFRNPVAGSHRVHHDDVFHVCCSFSFAPMLLGFHRGVGAGSVFSTSTISLLKIALPLTSISRPSVRLYYRGAKMASIPAIPQIIRPADHTIVCYPTSWPLLRILVLWSRF